MKMACILLIQQCLKILHILLQVLIKLCLQVANISRSLHQLKQQCKDMMVVGEQHSFVVAAINQYIINTGRI